MQLTQITTISKQKIRKLADEEPNEKHFNQITHMDTKVFAEDSLSGVLKRVVPSKAHLVDHSSGRKAQ